MAWFEAEQAVVRRVLDVALAAGLDRPAWWLAWAAMSYLERRWDKRNWIAWQTVALTAAARAGDRRLRAISNYNLGFAHCELGDLAQARTHLTAALHLYDDDLHGIALVHLNLGIVARREGRHQDALDEAGAAGELFARIGDHVGEARALNNLGWCHLTMGEHDEAVTCFRNSVDAFRDEHDRQYEAIGLAHLGDAEQAAGRVRAARDSWRRSLALLTEIDHPDADAVRAKLGPGDNRPRAAG
jgi:tetratricopeptide (TPR) repeat protein